MFVSKYNSEITIEKLLTIPEGDTFDRKEANLDNEKLAITISAFANTIGGCIVLGISDDKKIKGFESYKKGKVNEKLGVFTSNYLKFNPDYEYEIVNVNNDKGNEDQILLIHIFPNEKLIRTSKDKVYRRIGDNSIEQKGENLKNLEYATKERIFEDEIVYKSSYEDVDEELVEMYKNKCDLNINNYAFLKARKFLVEKNGENNLTSAGVLLFAYDPTIFFQCSKIKVMKVEGEELGTGQNLNIVKEQTFCLPLYKLIIKVREFINSQLREFNHLGENGKFIKVPEYPEGAWVEGIVNAVTHREYTNLGDYIKVFMFDDRLEIISPGNLPRLITIKNMRYERYSRNPQISRVLGDLGLVKEINEGVKRIYSEMENFFLDEPEFSTPNDNSLKLVLKNNIVMRSKRKIETMLKNDSIDENWSKLNKMEQMIVQYIHEKVNVSTIEIAEYIKRDVRTARRLLKKLLDLKIIDWIGTSTRDPHKKYIIKIN